jgi:uncharacterized protein YjbI with pentapeptide repeats
MLTSGANLEKADLWMANLSDARLGGSILRDANLNQANLTRADLSGSDNTQEHLITDLGERVIGPAEAKVRELRG